MWILGFSPGVCSTELRNLVSSLEYLVSNGRQVLLGGIRLGGSATTATSALMPTSTQDLGAKCTSAEMCKLGANYVGAKMRV